MSSIIPLYKIFRKKGHMPKYNSGRGMADDF